jgi:hypothetical protein
MLGRNVDITGVNIDELEKWMNSSKHHRKTLICQSFIALNSGASMTAVCEVLGVTRESVRLSQIMH